MPTYGAPWGGPVFGSSMKDREDFRLNTTPRSQTFYEHEPLVDTGTEFGYEDPTEPAHRNNSWPLWRIAVTTLGIGGMIGYGIYLVSNGGSAPGSA